MKSDKPKMVIYLSCKCQEKCIVRCFLRLIIMGIRANFPTCFIKSHGKLIESESICRGSYWGIFVRSAGMFEKISWGGVPGGRIFPRHLIEIERVIEEIAGGFSIQLIGGFLTKGSGFLCFFEKPICPARSRS